MEGWHRIPGKGAVVRVRFNEPANLKSCANFFAHAFPGEVVRNGLVLDLSFRGGSLNPEAQRKVIERLLWAWRRSHQVDTDDGFILPLDQDNPEPPAH